MCFSVFALLGKVMHWRDWRSWSPLVTPAGRKVLRWGSYITWAFVLVLFFLGPVAALANQWQLVAAMSTNPSDFLQSSLYMLQQSGQVFGTGILTTIELAVFGTCIAFVLALGLVFLRIQTPDLTDNDAVKFFKALGSGFARVYSTVIRGTPMMVQGMLIYSLGFAAFRATGMTVTEVTGVWTVFIAGLVTISLNSTAYMMEVLRGGIESVDGGQMEAARSLGLSQWQAMRKVVFPQGIKNSIPALSNELIVNIKDSSVLSVIGVFDLMFATTTVAGLYYKQMEVYVIAAVCYLALTMIFSRVLTALSRKLDVDAPGPVMSE
jgi:putative lysine transport system permease protein